MPIFGKIAEGSFRYNHREGPGTGRRWRYLGAVEPTTRVSFRSCFQLKPPLDWLTVVLSNPGRANYPQAFRHCQDGKLPEMGFGPAFPLIRFPVNILFNVPPLTCLSLINKLSFTYRVVSNFAFFSLLRI